MNHENFKQLLSSLILTQTEFAQVSKLTVRTVNMWETGQGAVSGPASARLELMAALSLRFLDAEKSRKIGIKTMKNGMHSVKYFASSSSGSGTLVLDRGRIYGVDVGGCKTTAISLILKKQEKLTYQSMLRFRQVFL
jgi:transcriptional regulator with XRE-family HTH domain